MRQTASAIIALSRASGIVMLTLAATACRAALTTHLVNPAATDPGITNFTADHHAYLATNVPPRNQLFLFIPGTTAIPADYTNITRTAAELGFHAVGLAYFNDTPINVICAQATDSTLFEQVRLEVIDGTDRTDKIVVSRTDSIENRLIQLLQYLDAHHPAENWGQYLSGTNLLWTKLLVAGHSQGGGHAGLLAKKHEVARCLMFDATDWWRLGQRPANWIYAPGATPTHRYFAFAHVLDPIGSNTFHVTWIAYGLPQFGAARLFENESGPPYSWTHQFWTDTEPTRTATGGDNDYHNGPVVDWCLPFAADGVTPLYKEAWKFMMAGPTQEPRLRIEDQHDGSVALSFQTTSDVIYQIKASDQLDSWTNFGNAILGNDTVRSVVDWRVEPQTFYRLLMSWGQ